VRELIVPYIETGRASPQVEKLTADLSMVSGNYIQARDDYERILDNDETNLKVANNLAWIYGHVDPVDLDKALSLANQAVGYAPDNASLRETRAQILVKQEKWREAAQDLEFALNGLPDYFPIHDALADCYEHLGQAELASAHRERSRLLKLKQVKR
jgi:tetratricopeptide (TPR) repeat protein